MSSYKHAMSVYFQNCESDYDDYYGTTFTSFASDFCYPWFRNDYGDYSYIMCFLMGLGVYPIKQSELKIRWIVYFSMIYSLIIWFIHAYFFFYILNFFTLKVIYPTFINMIVIAINIFSLFISIIMNFYYQKRFEVCLIKFAAIDDTLEELGTPKIYRKMHMLSKRVIIVWIVHSLVINFFDMLYWLNRKETAFWGLFLSHILNYCLHINTFLDLLFIFFLWYIGTRFEKVNEYVRCLLVEEKHELRCTWKKSIIAIRQNTLCIDNCKQILWTTMQLHLELCRLTREINHIFGTQMTLEMASYLLFLTVLCYYLYIILMQEQKEIQVYSWLCLSLWVFLFSVKLCAVNYICENVTIKANEIDKTIHQLTNSIRYANVWKEISQFTLQIMLHSLKFNGMGLFYFGNDFLRKEIHAIAFGGSTQKRIIDA
ncbi:uncharacterized protein LOC112638450 [Camponotus floridanus]|uniref:uncharacterized protein LOC112638450 n=1 Tax=Camponotus floridanus TaxID=104421 RepID=UPI000DC6661F|nr:uncharacterized protein LOC112638450 [Camponotus floridanus]